MFKKVITLLFGTAFMVVLMLAAGGIYLLPENFMGAYTNMYTDVWTAVGGLFSLMLVPGFVVGYAACQSRILGAVWFVGFVVLGFISGILCVKTAFGKKLGLTARFCLTKDGTASLRCLMMAALWAVLVFSISPAAIFIVWLAAVVVIVLVTGIFGAMTPGYSYEELISMGYSDYEARKLIQIAGGKINGI